MDKLNGRKAVHFWRESVDFEDSANSLNDDSIEGLCFRGFDKQPKVLLEKIDIEPYLQRNWKTKKLRQNLPQLVSNCFVKIAREDLQQLQREIRENSRRNNMKTKGILSVPALRCKVCEKSCSSERKLQNHVENKHLLVYKAERAPKTKKRVSFCEYVIIHELREYHKCRKCTKIFEKYQSLRAHMKQEHRKRKCYICHYCSKDFVDRMFFKVHIKHHCDICGLLLPNKRMYLQHRQTSCRVAKTYACKTCQLAFFSYMALKDHSYDHLDGIHVCDVCQAQYKSKCAVAIHIMYLHSSKPKELFSSRNIGNERLYVCNFCDISALDKNVMDRHVSMLPDAGTDFSCDQCLRQFDSETSMLQHKWSHFLNTNSQVQANAVETRFEIDKLPNLMQPRIVLERLDLDELRLGNDSNNLNREENNDGQTKNIGSNAKTAVDLKLKDVNRVIDSNKEADVSAGKEAESEGSSAEEGADISSHNELSVIVKKAIVDPITKKTLISNFQCEKCLKYFSSNYCLNRHKAKLHNYENLQCHICEQTFLWPSLLNSHKCLNAEMPLDNRSDFQYDNYREFGTDELMSISENEDYSTAVDFEIPEPIVQLTEYNNCIINNDSCVSNYGIPVNTSYKIVMQEVPIEF